MRKADFEKVLNADVEKAEPWFKTNVLEPLNRLFEYVKEAFDSNISVTNLKLQVIDFSFTAPFVTTSFLKTKPDPVAGVYMAQLIKADGTPSIGNAGFDWHEAGGQIIIDKIYSLGVGDAFKVKFHAMY